MTEIQNENNFIIIDLAMSLQHYLQFDDCFNRAAFTYTSSQYFYRCHIYYVVITVKLYMARGRCHIYYVFITVKLYMARGRCPIYYVFITVKLYMARGRLCIKARTSHGLTFSERISPYTQTYYLVAA